MGVQLNSENALNQTSYLGESMSYRKSHYFDFFFFHIRASFENFDVT